MAKAKIKINEAALRQIGRDAVDSFNDIMQPVVDAIHDEYAGRPVDEVKSALAAGWRSKAGKALPEPELTNVATDISQGRKVVLRQGR